MPPVAHKQYPKAPLSSTNLGFVPTRLNTRRMCRSSRVRQKLIQPAVHRQVNLLNLARIPQRYDRREQCRCSSAQLNKRPDHFHRQSSRNARADSLDRA
jgi:hypothetical protein